MSALPLELGVTQSLSFSQPRSLLGRYNITLVTHFTSVECPLGI
jgi:hypothetical protein